MPAGGQIIKRAFLVQEIPTNDIGVSCSIGLFGPLMDLS